MSEKIYLAKSYEGSEIVGEPYLNGKGKRYVKIRMACPRCFGSGFYGPMSVNNGRCFECNGRGTIISEVRAYSESEHNANIRAEERRKAREEECRQAEIKSHIDNKDALMKKWFENHGFTANGVTYVAAAENTYEIKDQLRDAGFQYCAELGWHAADPAGFQTIEIKYDQVCSWNDETARSYYNEDAKEVVKAAKLAFLNKDLAGEYFGTIGERLHELNLTFVSVKNIPSSYYGTKIYTFKDADGHHFEWFTATEKNLKNDSAYTVDGTVKDFKPFNGIKYTILTRCRIR